MGKLLLFWCCYCFGWLGCVVIIECFLNGEDVNGVVFEDGVFV